MSKTIQLKVIPEICGDFYTNDDGDLIIDCCDVDHYKVTTLDGKFVDTYCTNGFETYFTMPDFGAPCRGLRLMSDMDIDDKYMMNITDQRPRDPDKTSYLEIVPFMSAPIDMWGDTQAVEFERYETCGDTYQHGAEGDWDSAIDDVLRKEFPEATRLFVWVMQIPA